MSSPDRDNLIGGVESELRIRLAAYENALRAAAGDLAVSDHLKNPEDWHIFVDRSGLLTRYPGATGHVGRPAGSSRSSAGLYRQQTATGFARFQHPDAVWLVVSAAAPRRTFRGHLRRPAPGGGSLAGVGPRPVSPTGAQQRRRARDSGEPTLVPRRSPRQAHPWLGLQMFIPVYRNGSPVATVEQRRAALSGWVTGVFVADTFFHSALHGQEKFLDLQVFDQAVSPDSRLFSADPASPDGRPFERTTILDIDGAHWILGWNRTPQFPSVSRMPLIWAVGLSALVTLLVAVLIFQLQSTAQRTQTKLEIEQKRSEETRAFLAALVQSSDDSIVGTTLDGVIVSWNHGSERLWGYPADEAIGQHITYSSCRSAKPISRWA